MVLLSKPERIVRDPCNWMFRPFNYLLTSVGRGFDCGWACLDVMNSGIPNLPRGVLVFSLTGLGLSITTVLGTVPRISGKEIELEARREPPLGGGRAQEGVRVKTEERLEGQQGGGEERDACRPEQADRQQETLRNFFKQADRHTDGRTRKKQIDRYTDTDTAKTERHETGKLDA